MYQRQDTIREIRSQADHSQQRANTARDLSDRRQIRRGTLAAILATVAMVGIANEGARGTVGKTFAGIQDKVTNTWNHVTGNPDCSFEGGQTITVQPGETVWEYAENAQLHTGAVAHRIADFNGIQSGSLSPGQQITLPHSCRGEIFPNLNR